MTCRPCSLRKQRFLKRNHLRWAFAQFLLEHVLEHHVKQDHFHVFDDDVATWVDSIFKCKIAEDTKMGADNKKRSRKYHSEFKKYYNLKIIVIIPVNYRETFQLSIVFYQNFLLPDKKTLLQFQKKKVTEFISYNYEPDITVFSSNNRVRMIPLLFSRYYLSCLLTLFAFCFSYLI